MNDLLQRQLLKVPALKSLVLMVIVITFFHERSVPWSPVTGAIAGLILALIACLFISHSRWVWLCWAGALIMIISSRIAVHAPSEFSVAHVADTGREILVKGFVASDPVRTKNGIRFALDCDSVFFTRHLGWAVYQRVMVRMNDTIHAVPRYGDGLRIYGRLNRPTGERNPGEFNYATYLRQQGIYGVMRVQRPEQMEWSGEWNGSRIYAQWILPVRHTIQHHLHQYHSPLSAAVLSALILGDRTDLPEEIYQAFANSGTVHVLALSGLHTAFLLALLWGLLGFLRIPRRPRVLLVIVTLLYYAALTGFSPSITRAVIMISIVLIGYWLGHSNMAMNNLLIAAIVILFLDPDTLFHVGFQLSFIAVLSILWLYPRFKSIADKIKLYHDRYPAPVRGVVLILLVSAAAQIGTLPLTAYYFNRIPLLASLSNVCVIPLAGMVMALGFVTVGTSLFSVVLTQYYAALNEWMIWMMISVPQVSLKLPLAYVEWYTFSLYAIPLYFAVWIWLTFWKYRPLRMAGFFTILILLNIFLWRQVFFPDHELKIAVVDVGQGDCTVISTPGNKHIVIDAGDRNDLFDYGESVVAPYLRRQGIHRIHYLIMTHPHDDHIGGMAYLIREFEIDTVYHNGRWMRSGIFLETLDQMRRRNLPHRALREGDILRTDDGLWMGVLAPPEIFTDASPETNPNHASLIFLMRYGKNHFLWMGDAEKNHFGRLRKYAYLIRSDVIKVSHHGAENGTSAGFIRQVQPTTAVISVGRFNRFNHPSETVLRGYEQAGAEVLRTDQNGAVIFTADAQRVQRIR